MKSFVTGGERLRRPDAIEPVQIAPIHRRRLNSPQLVSELCLSTMTFGGQGAWWKVVGEVDQSNANTLVERARAAGVNFIDNADVYSEGLSERCV